VLWIMEEGVYDREKEKEESGREGGAFYIA
jgi:hypothetical protein